jgi:hypothetical protein
LELGDGKEVRETGSSAGGGASSPSATAAARSSLVRSAKRLHTTSAAKGAGAHTSTRASACVARTATMAATTVTVLPVPGGPNAQYGGPRGRAAFAGDGGDAERHVAHHAPLFVVQTRAQLFDDASRIRKQFRGASRHELVACLFFKETTTRRSL